MLFFSKIKRDSKVRKSAPIRGFSLVEAMAGIFILSIVVGGPIVIAGRAAQDIRQSKEAFTATYLAQELIELIRYKRDSIFLECSDATSVNCALSTFTGTSGPVNEFTQEAAWRIFKDHFGSTPPVNTLCFSAEGCTFDARSIITSPVIRPLDIYVPTSSSCSSLYQDDSNSLEYAAGTSSLDYIFLCNSHKALASTDTRLKRTVRMMSSSTFPDGSYDALYGDEIRVEVTVNYPFRGSTKTLIVTDYIKPRS